MDRFAIIGLGRFGKRLATLLAEAGADVLAVDRRKELVESVRDKVSLAVCMDSTDEESLRSQGIDKVDVAVVGIGTDFEANMLTTVLLKDMGVAQVISRATTAMRGQILSHIGADALVNPEQEAAERWSSRLLAPAIIERIELAEGCSLAQLAAPEAFFGKTLQDLGVRQKYGVNIVAIRRTMIESTQSGSAKTHETLISVPMADTEIQPRDILVVIGSDEALQEFPTK